MLLSKMEVSTAAQLVGVVMRVGDTGRIARVLRS